MTEGSREDDRDKTTRSMRGSRVIVRCERVRVVCAGGVTVADLRRSENGAGERAIEVCAGTAGAGGVPYAALMRASLSSSVLKSESDLGSWDISDPESELMSTSASGSSRSASNDSVDVSTGGVVLVDEDKDAVCGGKGSPVVQSTAACRVRLLRLCGTAGVFLMFDARGRVRLRLRRPDVFILLCRVRVCTQIQ